MSVEQSRLQMQSFVIQTFPPLRQIPVFLAGLGILALRVSIINDAKEIPALVLGGNNETLPNQRARPQSSVLNDSIIYIRFSFLHILAHR